MAEGFKLLSNRGYTSTVYFIPGQPPRVCKAFNQDSIDTLYPVERAAYERFAANDHPASILKYYGVHEHIPAGIVLEYAKNSDLHDYLWQQTHVGQARPDNAILCRWARQAVEALEFAHSIGVYNADIHCINFFLDQDLNLKVGDWAGASIDGSKSRSSYRLRYRLFDADGTDVPRSMGITAITEIFAMGTALYYMVTSHEPWPELYEPEEREEIKKRIREKDFPDTSGLPVLADIIWKCWHVEFTSMTEVKRAIEAETRLNGPKCSEEAIPPVANDPRPKSRVH
jgi:serine/threonine protein kinase